MRADPGLDAPARTFAKDAFSPGGRRAAVVVVGVVALASVVVYRNVLRSYFWSDDFVWFYLLGDSSLTEFLLTPIGGHTLVARNALLALTHAVAGLDPRPYFALALAIHALNVALLFRILWHVTGRTALAGLGALAWGTCPAASETLAWYSAHAEVAATACVLIAFDRVAARVGNDDPLGSRDLGWIGVWLALGSAFFGTTIAVAIVLPIAIAALSPRTMTEGHGRRAVLTAAGTTIALYALLQTIATWVYGTPLIPLTTARWFVARTWPAVTTFVELLRVGTASIVLGAWWSASPRPDHVSWVVLLVAAGVVVAGVAAGRGYERRVVLGFAVVALGNYALIAAARGPEAEPFWRRTPAEVAASLRYHYMAQAFLVATLSTSLAALARRVSPAACSALAIVFSVLLLVGVARHGVRVDLHDAARREIEEKLGRLQAEIATTRAGETLHIENEPVAAFGWMPNTVIPLPGLAALFVIAFPPDEVDDARIRFVERDPRELERFRDRGGRLGPLLEPPAAGEGGTAAGRR
jgi:hypothetical protein